MLASTGQTILGTEAEENIVAESDGIDKWDPAEAKPFSNTVFLAVLLRGVFPTFYPFPLLPWFCVHKTKKQDFPCSFFFKVPEGVLQVCSFSFSSLKVACPSFVSAGRQRWWNCFHLPLETVCGVCGHFPFNSYQRATCFRRFETNPCGLNGACLGSLIKSYWVLL